MTRAEKAERIQKILDRLYPEVPVPLEHGTVFQLLVAVLLFAGTALLLLVALVVVILLIITRRRETRRVSGRGDEGDPIADAWEESAKRTEPFE